mgnify:CR=1 FL=1
MEIPKTSIIDTLSKEWKDRKKYWLENFNIQSELGREDSNNNTRLEIKGEKKPSIFDPVLCEGIYNWFAVPSGSILDPFAGGSVRGIVAEELGYKYTGIDLSGNQIEANRAQSNKPTWIEGNSLNVIPSLNENYDFIFSCPPYYDLEIYSENKSDISNMSWEEFKVNYRDIIKAAVDKLKDNSFACFVVTEVRERDRKGGYCEGFYRGLVPYTVECFEAAGTRFYNDLILRTPPFFALLNSEKVFNQSSKIMSNHQNVLVFVKGNPNIASLRVKQHTGIECTIEGIDFESFEHAAIYFRIGVFETQRRIEKQSIRWINWNLKGKQKNPIYKLKIGDYLFESPKDATRSIPLTESDIDNKVRSNNPLYRHFIKLDNFISDISYLENESRLKTANIPIELPTICYEGKEYYSIQDAGNDNNLSSERVRQKLKSQKYKNSYYLY